MEEKFKLRMQIEEIYSHMRNLEDQIDSILEQWLPDHLNPWDVQVGTWRCLESPFGLCCYDKNEDPAFDQCIFCGKPHERK